MKIYWIIIFTFICSIGVQSQSLIWSKKSNPYFNSINSIAFNGDGTKVISGTDCHTAAIRMFDVNTGTLLWDYEVGSNFMCIMGIGFSSNNHYIASIEELGNMLIFDNTKAIPTLINTIKTGASYGFSIAFSPNGKELAVGCSNGKLKTYDISSGQPISDINAHLNFVNSVAYSLDGTKIVSGGADDKIKTWDLTGKLLNTYTGHISDVNFVKFTPDSKSIISASSDKKIKIWDANSSTLIQTISGHRNAVNQIDISPDGTKIVSASSDSTCKIWEFATGKMISSFGISDSGKINAVSWSPIGDKICTGNAISDMSLWNVSGLLKTADTHAEFTFEISPNPLSRLSHIDLPNGLIPKYYRIIDVVGNEQQFTTDLALKSAICALKPGNYILQITCQDQKSALKRFTKI